MRVLVLATLITFSLPAAAQDALPLVLQTVPRALSLAGSPQNLASLIDGLTRGTPVQLVAAGPAGFNRVVAFMPRERLSPAQAAARLELLRRDFDLLGVAQPAPEQVAATLGVAVRTFLQPDPRQATPEEQDVAALPVEIRSAVAGLPPKEALRTVELADQQLIALGTPRASSERRRELVQRVRSGAGYVSASAGATSFPPLSPLVAAPLWQP